MSCRLILCSNSSLFASEVMEQTQSLSRSAERDDDFFLSLVLSLCMFR